MATNLQDHIASLRTLAPDETFVSALKQRVMSEAQSEIPPLVHAVSPILPARFVSPIRVGLGAAGVTAFMLLLVVSNRLPMESAYTRSIADISAAAHAAESLETAGDLVAATETVHATVAQARGTLDSLKLMGAVGQYTQAQCKDAYIIYDRYLDGLDQQISHLLGVLTTSSSSDALIKLQSYVAESRAEAEQRLDLYAEPVN